MDDNRNAVDAAYQGQKQPASRRTYKRISKKQWEDQKEHIRTLYVNERKEMAEVVTLMKTRHNFDAGKKQFKRKADEWGFTKNIPNREMQKMVKERQRRKEEEGKATVFKRTRNGGTPDEVDAAKLDTFQKRNGMMDADSMSISSPMPSEIAVCTPISHWIMTPSDAGTPVDIPHDDGGRRQQGLSGNVSRGVNEVLKDIPISHYHSLGHRRSRGGYDEARYSSQHRFLGSAQSLRDESDRMADWKDKTHSLAITLNHIAELTDALNHRGTPRTIAPEELRIEYVSACILIVEWLAFFFHLPNNDQSMSSFRATVIWTINEILTRIEMIKLLRTETIVLQRDFQNRGAIVGEEHLNLTTIRRPFMAHERIRGNDPEQFLWPSPLTRSATPPIPMPESPSPFALASGTILESVLDSGERAKMTARIKNFDLLFNEAEGAFFKSNIGSRVEDRVETKLLRMLWHCERYTRAKRWDDIGPLLIEAHGLFMKPDTSSTFLVTHFPDRFQLLCRAFQTRLSIDELVHLNSHHGEPERVAMGSPAMTPQAPSPVPEVHRLFPLQTSGHAVIDVGAWRQSVTSQSATSFSPLPMPSPRRRQGPQFFIDEDA
ncbi:hypothetical protein EG328_004523 [Venturia inaequalis]|uniref:Clr5 domain-containing protein n=1 Tax=Venturia inaequalis TaxID=5025 RepID=A0A8H3YY42_VENIN|nr:hypothetical protein EG328_004523 [Venturia inaequalis]